MRYVSAWVVPAKTIAVSMVVIEPVRNSSRRRVCLQLLCFFPRAAGFARKNDAWRFRMDGWILLIHIGRQASFSRVLV